MQHDAARQQDDPTGRAAIRRELYYFTLYRILEAAVLCLVVFSPVGLLIGKPDNPMLSRVVAVLYLVAASLLFLTGRKGRMRPQVVAGALMDVSVAVLAIHALPGAASGISMMLLFNVGATALLLPLRLGLGAAALAALALIGEYLLQALSADGAGRPLAELLMFTISYLAMATLTNLVGRQMRASEALAARRGSQADNLAEINELIIRRMRTGVLLVDGDGEVKLANEASMLQLGGIGEGRRTLAHIAPALAKRLQLWQQNGTSDAIPLQLSPDLPEVLPRFARLLADDAQVLVFLDDTSLVSRRAESLTLATLGRFSASLAHEIRNPLAAISYATQLMEESPDIPEADRRLLAIIYQQTHRMNGIVENVLSMARRERAQPEHVELVEFARLFVEDYRNIHPLENDQLELISATKSITAIVDRRQLQQAVTALVHNALVYGRMPGQPARVSLRVHVSNTGAPVLDVADRGPGMPESVSHQLFRPFFTTSEHGTGLGLYIARELCTANQATLEHVAVPAGGCCFRIQMAGAGAFALN
ncbi:MAG: ATP-binding protein [Pseudomonadota bacterium]|nr:ATP-binding protein [Pseudomonadota bacterium]